MALRFFVTGMVAGVVSLIAALNAEAQPLGTFTWQLQPFCNVVTVNVTQQGAVYTMDGYDDQCGAARRAPIVGAGTPNPDGSIGLGWNVVTVPGGRGLQIDARITLPSASGSWTDSAGNAGTLALGASTGGTARPLPATAAAIPGAFSLLSDGGFLASWDGTAGQIPASGAGTRLMWHSTKSAFRAGSVRGTQWDDPNMGWSSAALGYDTVASGMSSVAAGMFTTASGETSLAMGNSTRASGLSSTAIGSANIASGSFGTALGRLATASGADGSTAIGHNTLASGQTSTAMGFGTIASGQISTAFGLGTTASGKSSTAMGESGAASGIAATSMGYLASANGTASAAIGHSTTASGYASVATGQSSVASGDYSTAMGRQSTASGGNSTAIGTSLSAAGGASVVMGVRAATTAQGNGSFVYGDQSTGGIGSFVTSSSPNQFLVRAAGGVTFYSNAALSAGVTLAAGGSGWGIVSDVNMKENFRDLPAGDVLARIAAMPVREWNYTTQDSSIRHVGPTAQDFHAAFGLGESDLRINTIDADGIALAAVKALEERTRVLAAENDDLRARLARLEALLKQ